MCKGCLLCDKQYVSVFIKNAKCSVDFGVGTDYSQCVFNVSVQ